MKDPGMVPFVIELVLLSAVIYYILDLEFKRLKKQYAFHRLFTSILKIQFEEFSDRMVVFGMSAKKTAEQLAKYKEAFEKGSIGRVMYLPDGMTIRHIPKE